MNVPRVYKLAFFIPFTAVTLPLHQENNQSINYYTYRVAYNENILFATNTSLGMDTNKAYEISITG
jgi:hypothetical protein